MFFDRWVRYCRKFVFILLSVLWNALVYVYYLWLMIYRRWSTDGLRSPGMAALQESLMVVWNQWKYPLTLTLFFLLMYGFICILDPTPTVNLPDDIRLLLSDRRRSQLPAVTSAGVPVIVEHNFQAVVASELLYHVDNTNAMNKGSGIQNTDRKNLDIDQVKMNFPRMQDKDRIGDKQFSNSADDEREIEREKLDKWLERREIVGNEHFVNRFQNGIQKPEDFYERNKDAVVKIESNEHTSSTITTQPKADVNTRKVNRSATSSLSILTTTSAESITEKHHGSQNYVDIWNRTLPEKTRDSKLTADLGHFPQEAPWNHTHFDKADPLHQVDSKTESTTTSVQPVEGSGNTGIRYISSSRPGSRKRTRRKPTVNGTTLADLESAPYPPLIVKATGAFLDRVRAYNAAIAAASAEMLRRRGYGPWRDVADAAHLKVVWGNTDDFLERLSEHAAVKTVLLPWTDDGNARTLRSESNALINKYYAWSATAPLCAWIMTPGFTKARWDAVYNRECNEEISLATRPQSLEFMYLYAKPINVAHYWPNYGTAYPAYFYTRPPPYVFYVHLLRDGVVNTVGDVISGDLKLVPYTCSHDKLPTVPAEYAERPVYRQLFVMTQFWGQSFFHKMVEVMPRIAPYVDFLRANPSVQIHAPEDRSQVSEMLRMIGIDPVRVVTGVTRAKLVYVPQGTPCGFPDARAIQLLSQLLRQHVRSRRPRRRNRLIYVRRSGLRRFAVDGPIEFVLRAVAERRRLNFTVFGDRPTPALSTAAELFNDAVAVVGPHGAGLSNVVFCEPGSALVEGVCNEPHVNMCYQMTAHMLGLRYHAIPSRGGCERVVDVTASDVETAVDAYVDMVLADMRQQPHQ